MNHDSLSRATVEKLEWFARPGTCTKLIMLTPQQSGGKGSIMIWGCFWAGGFGPLAFVDGSVDQDAYINILARKFMPWFIDMNQKEDQSFILQEDGATCHTGEYATWWTDSH